MNITRFGENTSKLFLKKQTLRPKSIEKEKTWWIEFES